ncbi:MAG: class III extradiol dioxygenase subunit B-like domain-containing protein [Patescibacteria group bacterium]|jgi:AmmeMemoRadiSam system protein B
MLVFAAHVPHTPLLIPAIGRENTEALKKTEEAVKIVAEELYAARPEVIIVVAEHGNPTPNSFAINLNDKYQTDLSEFGDLATKNEYLSELAGIDNLQRFVRSYQIPFTLFSESAFGHAVAVPLIKLTEKLKKFTVLPLFAASELSAKKHFELGQLLRENISSSNKRVAIISAGDLSHALSSDAPAGLRPEGAEFDAAVRQAVNNVTASGLLQLDEQTVIKAAECAYRPILITLGLLGGLNVRSEELCYEAPFGVGYLTVQFHLS